MGLGTSSTDQSLWKVNYDYGTTDNNGNVKSQTITVPTITAIVQDYTYDSLNRIKDATETVSSSTIWKQTFSYDRYGNRRFDTTGSNTTTIPGGCSTAQCNPTIDTANNRFTTGQGYTYDSSGNLLTDAEGRTFTYDAENKQKTVANSGGTIGTYSYDGDGKRVKNVSATETTLFVYDVSGKMVAEYLLTEATPASPVTSYLTNDTLGSPRVITDSSGNVTSRRDFMPFGEEISAIGGRTSGLGYQVDATRQKFTGYERDSETDLDFAQARMYSNKLGRFTTPDPIFISAKQVVNPQIWNLYSYASNNPLNTVDPNGMTIIRLGKRSDEDIDKDMKNVEDQLQSKDISKDERNALNTRKTELELEKKGNAWLREQLKIMKSLGFTHYGIIGIAISTDSQKDFGPGSEIAKAYKWTDKEATDYANGISGELMFTAPPYYATIFINANAGDTANMLEMFDKDDPDPDGQLYVASVLEHEYSHITDFVYDTPSAREQRALDHQKSLLKQWLPKMLDQARGEQMIKNIQKSLDKLKGVNK